MDKRKRTILIAVLLILSIGNFTRISSNSNIRTVEFISILAIGILSGLLIRELFAGVSDKKDNI